MGMLSEIRARARHVIGPVAGICAIAYFAFHVISGERGVVALYQLKQSVVEGRIMLAKSTSRRVSLERKINMLRLGSIDPDMLEERARIMLNYGFDDDLIILLNSPTGPCFPLAKLK